jgi:thiol-disulfide isomerase/thioredoxin
MRKKPIMKNKRRLFLSVCAGLAMALCLPASAAYETDYPVEFTLPQLGGGEVSLADHRGKWVVLNYWATWCAPCRKEMPELSELHDARADVVVLGLAYEDTDDAAFEEFLADLHVTFPVLRVDVYSPPEPFGAPKVLPTTIILDQRGHAVKAFLGPVTRQSLEDYINGRPVVSDEIYQ